MHRPTIPSCYFRTVFDLTRPVMLRHVPGHLGVLADLASLMRCTCRLGWGVEGEPWQEQADSHVRTYRRRLLKLAICNTLEWERAG
jgi:hypothetical protein